MSNNLVIILSHCDSAPKVKVLKETIASLRSIDVDILLTSHVPVDLDVQDMVDYYIFDKSNPIIDPTLKCLVMWARYRVGSETVETEVAQPDHWGGVMNQIIKAADIGLSLDYDCYSFIGYDVVLEEVHLKELNNPCPTEDIVTCDWGDSSFETKKINKYSRDKQEEALTKTFVGQYASCDFNIIKKDCFKKIRNLLSIEKYLARDSNGKRFFDVAEEYWTSLVYLFKPRFVKRIQEKVQIGLNQNHLNDLFKMFISKNSEGVRDILFFDIKESVKFRVNNEKIIEIENNHLETDVRQIQHLTKDGPYIFSKELEESDRKSHLITVLDD